MILRFLRYPISLVLLGIFFNGCIQSDYTKLVKSELAKGIRQDSLLLGINFGDTRNDFYVKCLYLNKQQLIREGPGNSSVQYLFIDSLVHTKPAEIGMLFMPTFDKDEAISEMNMEFSYLAWAPWNREYQSDSLKVKVMELLIHWYKGNDFITATIKDSEVPVKVDGNRRILVFIHDQQRVVVKVQDILNPMFRHSITADQEKKN
jgi:hypothetical protein